MSSSSTLSRRGAYANDGAKLPGLQGMRVTDPQTQKALEALREWVEVRLGSRGDKYEKAVTLRELEVLLEPITTALAKQFNGDINTLSGTPVSRPPGTGLVGSFTITDAGEMYFYSGTKWRKITAVDA